MHQYYDINLRDIYSGVGPKPLCGYQGFDAVGCESEQSAMLKLTMQGGKFHFLEGNKMFAYLWRNIVKHCNDVVSFVVPGLRKIYLDNIDLFEDERKEIIASNAHDFYFYNVYNYGELSQYNSVKNVNEYQLIGTINAYDMLHMPVAIFIAVLNTTSRLEFRIHENIIIYIQYNKNDFFDLEYQKDIRFISYEPYKKTMPYINWDNVHACKK